MASFDHTLPMILHRTLDCVMPEFRELFARHNLTDQQWRVLRILWEQEKIASADLSARSLIPAPSLVGVIDRLEKRKLVARVRSIEDRRIVYIVATAEGRKLGGEILPMVDEINNRVRQSISKEEWDAMETALKKITTHMNRTALYDAEIA